MSDKIFEEALWKARALEEKGNRLWALREVASVLANAGRLEEALREARAIEVESDRDDELGEMISALVSAGRFAEALREARAIEYPGVEVVALGKIAAAVAEVERKASGQRITTGSEIGMAEFKEGDIVYHKATGQKSFSADEWSAKGLIHHEEFEYDEAIKDYTKAIDINPHEEL